MARTLSQAWPTSSWSTNSVVWRLGALTETLMRERPTRWASGRHGSKPARAMIRLTLWSLPISGSVLTVSLAETATFPLMAFKYPLADSITAAATSRAALEVLQAFGYYRLCSSARTRRHRIQLQTNQLRHFTSGLLTSQPAAVFPLTPLRVKAFFPALMVAAITMGLTSPLLRQHFRRGTGKPTTPRSRAICVTST